MCSSAPRSTQIGWSAKPKEHSQGLRLESPRMGSPNYLRHPLSQGFLKTFVEEKEPGFSHECGIASNWHLQADKPTMPPSHICRFILRATTWFKHQISIRDACHQSCARQIGWNVHKTFALLCKATIQGLFVILYRSGQPLLCALCRQFRIGSLSAASCARASARHATLLDTWWKVQCM